MRLEGHGLALEVGRGWEARMWMPELPPPAVNRPVIRLANFPLPLTRDTYAAELAEGLAPGHVVASLVEFEPSSAGAGLYANEGVPRLRVDDLDPRAVQGGGSGRAGLQRFFSSNGRAFSLYVLARDGAGVPASLRQLEEVLGTLTVAAA